MGLLRECTDREKVRVARGSREGSRFSVSKSRNVACPLRYIVATSLIELVKVTHNPCSLHLVSTFLKL